LYQLQHVKGLEAVLLQDDHHNTEPQSVVPIKDQLGVAANLRVLMEMASDILIDQQDTADVISMEMNNLDVLIYRVPGHPPSYLTCVCQKSLSRSVYEPHILKAVSSLQKISELVSNLHSGTFL